MNFKHLITVAAMLLAGTDALAQAGVDLRGRSAVMEAEQVDWVGYRNAYQQMLKFEKYGKPKQFLQQHFQLQPHEKGGGAAMDRLRVSLVSKTLRLELPLDALGRMAFPFLKVAYDDNAVLSLNFRSDLYSFRPRISIVPRSDGIYDVADLQAACNQMLDYLRYAGESGVKDKKCTGITFAYAPGTKDVAVRFRATDAAAKPAAELAAGEGAVFSGDLMTRFKTVVYRFADWPARGQIITQTAPLAIAGLFD
jgi:hypothetical protein